MRLLPLLSLVALAGCGGGVTPELYAIAVDFFTLPDACFSNNAQPSAVTVTAQPQLFQVQVWDAAEQTAILEIVEGPASIDMGDAPSVPTRGLLKGKVMNGEWTFSGTNSTKTTLTGRTLSDTTSLELKFVRGTTFKGAAALSGRRECSGSTCSGTQPSCTVSTIPLNGTRLQVAYERAP
ncbi:MAG: hypothetical protein INH41_08780 [Myxococcaceae bacterium]|nr:hypothetical protein [Myxococcaceae bacterium]MCA3012478.1 hypothetical protein [Myxococcaceae bacterium]